MENAKNENYKLPKMMDTNEMIIHLKEKNIKFKKISIKKAKRFLNKNNSYYNLVSYVNNFRKYPSPAGRYEGKYIDLDFAYLKDLSIIDYRVRLILFKMLIDIEHYLKIKILNNIINLEDGYNIVNMYLEKDYNDERFPKKLHNSIFSKIGSVNYQKIFSKYDLDKDKKLENIPIWVFLEIITFGELVNFYDFYVNIYNLEEDKRYIYVLREVVKLRNAICHNNSILTDLGIEDNKSKPDYFVEKYLKKSNITEKIIKSKLSNSRIRQISYTLYLFNIIVTSENIKKITAKTIKKFMERRILLHSKYYNNNELLKSVYSYFLTIINTYY